jgi:hypothetical protein
MKIFNKCLHKWVYGFIGNNYYRKCFDCEKIQKHCYGWDLDSWTTIYDNKMEKCPECNGKGISLLKDWNYDTCSTCGGKRRIKKFEKEK